MRAAPEQCMVPESAPRFVEKIMRYEEASAAHR